MNDKTAPLSAVAVDPLVRCVACGGNDGDIPCAYPSEGKAGCIRDNRISYSMKCYYCKSPIWYYDKQYAIKRAVLPLHRKRRFRKEGVCCCECKDAGKALVLDSWAGSHT